MVDFGELRVRLGLDSSSLKAGLAQAKSDLTTWRDETNKGTADMAKWGAAIGATIAPIVTVGTAVYAAQQKFGAMADQIDDLSMTTGMSTEKIQQLQYAAVLSNDSFSTVAMGINYLTLSMQKAGDATSETGKAFAALGVSTAGKSPDQVFEEIAAALMGMEDTTKRNEIAMALYGRSWKEMLPFMEEYIQNKEKISKTPTFSKQELQDLKDAKKAWDDLGNSVTIYSGKALVNVENAYARAKNGADILTAAQQLNIDKMREALEVANKLEAKEGDRARAAFEAANSDALSKFNKGFLSKPALGARTSGTKASSSDPFAGMSSEEANIAYLRDYTIPSLKRKYDDLAAAAVPDLNAIAEASKAVIDARQELADAKLEGTINAMKDLKDATDEVTKAQAKLNDINKDYTRDIQTLDPTDVRGFIDLRMRHQWDVEDQTANINTARAGRVSAFGEVGKAAMASAGITITGPITVNGDKSFEKMVQEERIRAGVR